MPERWERELAKLGSVEADDEAVRRRVEAGSRMDGQPRRADRIGAGVVAGLVAVAAIALIWRTLPRPSDLAGASGEVPMLSASFHDSDVVPERPDSSYRRVQTTISFGDALEKGNTSTTAEGAIVDWVAVDDLTRFVPGPTVGSEVEFQADGDDARVLLGSPGEWPNFDAFTPIDRLPLAPGEYVLVFEATYPEGIARTARRIELVEPSLLQLVLHETTDDVAVSGDAYLDGRRAEGFLSESSFIEGDAGPLEKIPEAPRFGPDDWLPVPIGSQIALAVQPTTAAAGVFPDFAAFDPKEPLPIDIRSGDALVGVEPGRWLLTVEATWVHPAPGPGDYKTTERALFFFPIDALTPVTETPKPSEGATPSLSPSAVVSPEPSPSPSVGPVDEILVRIEGLGRSERSRDWPVMTVSFRGRTALGCTEAFEWTLADRTRIEEASGRAGSILPQCSYEPLFVVPPRTPIVVESEPGTDVTITRTTTPLYAGTDGVGAGVRWPDGNAYFIAYVEVRYEGAVRSNIELSCPAEDRIAFAAPGGPRILPGGSAYIRGNLEGFRQDDVIEQMTKDPDGDTEWSGVWQVVREGSVVAAIDFSSLGGVACRGSGIGGV
jgi:hypothetical protein